MTKITDFIGQKEKPVIDVIKDNYEPVIPKIRNYS